MTSTASITAYLNTLPQSRRGRVEALLDLITRLYPDAEASMHYRMPTFTRPENNDAWLAVGNQKRYVSLYTCGAPLIAAFKQKHPELKTGVGCINLRDRDPLPLDDLADVVHRAMQLQKSAPR